MEFSDISFTEHGGRYGSTLGFLAPGGYFVFMRTAKLMLQRANEELPKLDWSQQQTAETIFGGKVRWLAHNVGARIALGRSLKYFADHEMLPLEVANPRKRGKRKYRHK